MKFKKNVAQSKTRLPGALNCNNIDGNSDGNNGFRFRTW